MSTKTEQQHQELSFEDLYNVLMERVEPELCTYNLDQLDEIYQGEKDTKRVKRYAYYTRCLDLFWDALKELIDLTKTDLKEFEDEFFVLLKKKVTTTEQGDISAIEQSISES